MGNSIGDRMKVNYEDRYRHQLTRRTPVIMRLDGKAFHTLARGCVKPFDEALHDCMKIAAGAVLKEVQGAQCAYLQSDEINILLVDYKRLNSEAWFDYNIQKMTSVAASVCSVAFSNAFIGSAHFDCRVFNIPEAEVCNYFIWRQQDWARNSLSMFAQSFFSTKELHKKNGPAMHEMLHGIGENWADLPLMWKSGTFIEKLEYDHDGSIRSGWFNSAALSFTKYRDVIEKLLEVEQD